MGPLYVRHKYDGTITNSIAYPLTRSLYGRRVRQPIGGDFGFSGRLAEIYSLSEAWSEAIANFGIDIWMTTLAMNNGIPICQAFMGRPKIHKPKDPGADLGPMFRQVVGTIFEMMIRYALLAAGQMEQAHRHLRFRAGRGGNASAGQRGPGQAL